MTAHNSAVEPIEKSWSELNRLVESLGQIGLTTTGPDGWAVKDHLVHVAAWEHSLIALLDGSDRRSAMGVGPEVSETDSINAAVWSLHREETPEQALAYFHQTHAQLMKLLGGMSEAHGLDKSAHERVQPFALSRPHLQGRLDRGFGK